MRRGRVQASEPLAHQVYGFKAFACSSGKRYCSYKCKYREIAPAEADFVPRSHNVTANVYCLEDSIQKRRYRCPTHHQRMTATPILLDRARYFSQFPALTYRGLRLDFYARTPHSAGNAHHRHFVEDELLNIQVESEKLLENFSIARVRFLSRRIGIIDLSRHGCILTTPFVGCKRN